MSLVGNDLRARYRRSILGVGWSLLHPLSTTLVTCLVFHEIFDVSIAQFAPLVLSGLACWNYITGVVLQGCQSYVHAESYIKQHPLPMAVYPLRMTLVAFSHFLIALMLVLVMTSLCQGPVAVVALVYLVPGLLIFFCLGWSCAILMAFLHVVFRDTQHILEVMFQVAFYLTPVIYPVRVLQNSRVGWLTAFNPLLHLLNLIRQPLQEGSLPSPGSYAVCVSMTVCLGVLATVSLGWQQRRVVLYL
jgi:ABC-type polysaccharide/polyol phosphate export permease